MQAKLSRTERESPIGDADALLRAHFEASPTGILISSIEGEIETFNDRFLQLWTLSPESPSMNSAHDLLLYMSSQVADCQSFIRGTHRYQQDPNLESRGDLVHLATGRTLSCNTGPVRAANGKLLGRVWDYQDVTDVIASSSELRLARYALDRAGTPVLWIEEDGTIASANLAASSSLGYSRTDLETMSVWDLNPDRTPAMWAKLWDRVKEAGEGTFEGFQKRRDGTAFPVEVTAHFFRFDQTELLCGFVRDLTEPRRAEEERRLLEESVQEAQKHEGLTLLSGGIAHDLNNLLVGVVGNSSLALERAGDEPELTSCLEHIRDAGVYASALTSQLLSYAGGEPAQREALDLSELVRTTDRLVAAGVAMDCTLERELASDLPRIDADPTQFRQLLLNLVTNASEALRGECGTVSICTREETLTSDSIDRAQLSANCKPGRYAALEVSDTGIGMDAATVSRVFDPHFSTKLSAHGLGLAAVRDIVQQHGALMRIDSTPGGGSSFTVLVPATNGKATQAAPPPEQDHELTGRALLVDDNPRVLEVGQRLLETLGFEVSVFDSGAAALAAFEYGDEAFDLAIVDLIMPGVDGSEVARVLHLLNPDLPILLSSGCGEVELAGQVDARPGMTHLPKPYTLQDLRSGIQAVYPPPGDDETDEADWLPSA